MPYFQCEEPFQFKAPFFCGPAFFKHLPQVFLVSVIPKPFLSYCDFRDGSLGTPPGTGHSDCGTSAQPCLSKIWVKNWKTVFLVETKENWIVLPWSSTKLPSQGHIVLSNPLLTLKLGLAWHFLSDWHSPLISEQNASVLQPGTRSWFI